VRIVYLIAGLVMVATADAAPTVDALAPPPDPAVPGADADHVVPPVRERTSAEQQAARIAVNGFIVHGVGEHRDLGITPAGIESLAQAEYAKLVASSGDSAKLTFAQLQSVADKITERYKKAGFIVARAYLPAQAIGEDKIVRIDVLEGSIGKVIVKGAKRYYPAVIAAPVEKLKGQPLLKDDVDSALLYDRDLPGLSVSATFQPGEKTGDTDLVILASEPPRPIQFTLGGNNYGTSITGRYRVQAGIITNSLLGIGDQFVGKVEYALDPRNNIYGAATLTVPTTLVTGLSSVIGFTRNQLQISTGDFAALNITGPTTAYFSGAQWKFLNTVDVQLQSQALILYERSQLSAVGQVFADDKFLLASLKFSGTRTDRLLHGIDVLELGVRKSIQDGSQPGLSLNPDHDRNFVIGTLNYTRLQYLTASQRLVLKANGQFTDNALIPLEQFVLGGPDSVRAYPIADALRDRGYYTALEYHIDAPGFGSITSPFYGRPWRELIEFEVFADYSKGFAVAGNRQNNGSNSSELSGAGAGVIFRIPKFYQMQFHLQGAAPFSGFNASDGNDYHIYGQIGFTF